MGLSKFYCKVEIKAGETQSFYISAKSSIFLGSISSKSSTTEDDNIIIDRGVGLQEEFGQVSESHLWNGHVKYKYGRLWPFIDWDICSQNMPTGSPTKPPTKGPTNTPTRKSTNKPTSPPTNRPTRLSSKRKILTTPLDGSDTLNGHMFDITAGSESITILGVGGVAVKSKKAVKFDIWTKVNGHYGFERRSNAWKLIHSGTVKGGGSGRTVSLGYFGCRVMVGAGKTQAFYVSAESSIFMSSLSSESPKTTDDVNISISRGVGLKAEFDQVSKTHLWSGNVKYRLGTQQPKKRCTT